MENSNKEVITSIRRSSFRTHSKRIPANMKLMQQIYILIVRNIAATNAKNVVTCLVLYANEKSIAVRLPRILQFDLLSHEQRAIAR